MIIVTGATGQLGSQIVDHLLERVPADQIGVSVRDTDRAADIAERGVRVRRGNYNEPDTLADAFEGASQVLLISSNETGRDAVAQHAAATEAARTAGAERVLYTSHQAASADSLFAPMPDHAATEKYLAGSGIAYTSLRNGFYASTVPRLLGQALETGQIVAPADGAFSWTTHADLAEAAAVILTDPGRFEGPTPALTAPDAVTLDDIAAILTELSGRTFTRTVAADDDFVSGMTSRGVPAPAAGMLIGMFEAARNGEFATTDPTLEKILGRPPVSIRTVLEGLLAAS